MITECTCIWRNSWSSTLKTNACYHVQNQCMLPYVCYISVKIKNRERTSVSSHYSINSHNYTWAHVRSWTQGECPTLLDKASSSTYSLALIPPAILSSPLCFISFSLCCIIPISMETCSYFSHFKSNIPSSSSKKKKKKNKNKTKQKKTLSQSCFSLQLLLCFSPICSKIPQLSCLYSLSQFFHFHFLLKS